MYSRDTEVRSVDDLRGQKVRVQATRTEDITFAEYGAQTVHMQFSEIYTSLQTGVIDMAENALMYYGAAGHYDVAPIMSLTEHEGNTQIIWVTDKAWNSMSEEEKGWVQDGGRRGEDDGLGAGLRGGEGAQGRLQGRGRAVRRGRGQGELQGDRASAPGEDSRGSGRGLRCGSWSACASWVDLTSASPTTTEVPER